VRDPYKLVNETLIPLNKNSCNFILNVAPNREGFIDDNALEALKQIGKLWKNTGRTETLHGIGQPITSTNLAKNEPVNSSWSDDMNIMDFANDDNFRTSWKSNVTVKEPWFAIEFAKDIAFNTIVLAETKPNISRYKIDYWDGLKWKELFNGENKESIKVHRFERVWGNKVRLQIYGYEQSPSIAEFQVYNERK
jgi:alpha-L-fucosidase